MPEEQEQEEQKPFLFLRLCPACGYWRITNAFVDAFVIVGGATYLCPHDRQALYTVQSDDALSLKQATLTLNQSPVSEA